MVKDNTEQENKMITIGDIHTGNCTIEETVWICHKAIDIGFENDGESNKELEIVICDNKSKETGEKTITVIKLGKNLRVGDSIGEHYDALEHLSSTLDLLIEKMFPNEDAGNQIKLIDQIFHKIENVINDEEMEFQV